MNDKMQSLLEKIQKKYEEDGEDPSIYLEGLYHQRYITYWDYIQTDVLLNLQKPETEFPDEMVFIIYHQITELYFKLILHECAQIRDERGDKDALVMRVDRITRYFRHLTHSFSIMTYGMEPEQFLKFRIALTPASGFQSVQFRYIELAMTPLINLIRPDKRAKLVEEPLEKQYPYIYWKQGATEVDTDKKAMVLQQFEAKYDDELLQLARDRQGQTLLEIFRALPETHRKDPEVERALRDLDHTVNVKWPKVHYKTAAHYLEAGGKTTEATGGTNWKKYLPPSNQQITFFPDFWSEKEIQEWGT